MKEHLPTGKLPTELLARYIGQIQTEDPRILLGPGVGNDCAVLDFGDTLLVLKSDPITFTSEEIGWYAVQVNANDIATTGATPRWLLTTLLLPEDQTTPDLFLHIGQQLDLACREIDVKIIGGHSEITHNLNRPLLVGTMIGEVNREQLVIPQGTIPGDCLLLTKGVPIEATTILAREFPDRLLAKKRMVTDLKETRGISQKQDQLGLTKDELEQAKRFLYQPGISVLRDAQIATRASQVHAMHDPTEGGLYTALWELATASNCSLMIRPETIKIPSLSARICQILGLDPLAAIASGALLICVSHEDAQLVCDALEREGIVCDIIGEVLDRNSSPTVWGKVGQDLKPLPWPERDEIARLYED